MTGSQEVPQVHTAVIQDQVAVVGQVCGAFHAMESAIEPLSAPAAAAAAVAVPMVETAADTAGIGTVAATTVVRKDIKRATVPTLDKNVDVVVTIVAKKDID